MRLSPAAALALVQGSEEWKAARIGSLGASRVHDATAKIKSGYGASRANVMSELIVEHLTGIAAESYTNAAMAWGTEKEPDARVAYEFRHDCEVQQVGLIYHPRLNGTHASPDGFIGDTGLLEIKCPQTATHLDTLLNGTIDGKYIKQCQWQLACTERAWCDWVSYDPRLPESMRLFVKRLHRDDKTIGELETEITSFLNEMKDKIARLKELYEPTNLLAAG